jgi:small subunit ribosomal protein S2
VWIVDTNKEHIAVDEAKKLNIPVVAILDSNCDPDDVDYRIPGNDDAIRSVTLLTRVIADAVAEGLQVRHGGKGEAAEPRAAWEQDLLAGSEGEQSGGSESTATAEGSTAPEAAEAEAAEGQAAETAVEATESTEAAEPAEAAAQA